MAGSDEVFAPKAMLVTGGAGFIGANYVRHVLAALPDLRVVTLDKLTYAGSLENLQDLPHGARHTFVQGDICDAEQVARVLAEHQVDCIVHFAAESHVDRSISGPAAFIDTNVVGTFTLLEAARRAWFTASGSLAGACRFHHVSTDEVFGTLGPDAPAFREDMPYCPNSPYSASKAGSDHLVRAYHHTYGLPVVTTHCSNNYGPRQHSEKLIPTVIRTCRLGQPIPVYGDGSNIRDWLYVDDHCAALLTVLRYARSGETFNIGGRQEHNNLDIVHRLCALMDEYAPRTQGPHAQLIRFVTDRPGHDWRYAIDQRKLETTLGWSPSVDFDTGLRRTVQWYLAEGLAAQRLGIV